MFRAFARGTFPSLDPFWIILGWPIDHFKRKWNNLPSINFQQICWFSRGAEPQQSCHAPFLEDTLIPNSEAGKLETLPLPSPSWVWPPKIRCPRPFELGNCTEKKQNATPLRSPKLVSSLGEVGWVFFCWSFFQLTKFAGSKCVWIERNSGP